MSDYVDKLLREANELSVVRACHKCRHFEGHGKEEYDDRWCMAAGMTIPEARADEQQCGPDLKWWEPRPEPKPPITPTARLSLPARLFRRRKR